MSHHRLHRIALSAIISALAAQFAAGCDDQPGITDPKSGDLTVTVATTGSRIDLDSDGYTVSVDGGSPLNVASSASVTFRGLAPGTHVLLLAGLAPNCSVSGANPRSVEIGASGTSGTIASAFFITCAAKTGSIQISVATSGPDADANGYALLFAGRRGDIESNGTRSFPDIREGSYDVFLTDLAGNCSVDGPNPVRVNVSFGTSAPVAFTIKCVKAASLVLSVSTTGVDADLDGYYLNIRPEGSDDFTSVPIQSIGTTVVSALRPGVYTLGLTGITMNCTSAPSNPRTVTASSETVNIVSFEITCTAATTIAFVRGNGTNSEIYSVKSNGSAPINLTASPGADLDPAWSPDGNRIAFASERDGDREIYVMNADGTGRVRLTNHGGEDSRPAWSPDGRRIAFVSNRDGNYEIYVMNSDGTNVVRLTNRTGYDGDPTWSPDGTKIAFASNYPGTAIWVMNADGSNVVRLTTSPVSDRQPAWSPDGLNIAFSRDVSSSRSAIFVMTSDGSNVRQLTPELDQAQDPTWSPDSRTIAFGGIVSYDYYYA
ncbi:MAG TPA: hypothetical protein VHM24_14210, partial [Gemmatimonadaceae bacterium]|nr:hypothetical protein [Gemmatimonadaceae bacterium]